MKRSILSLTIAGCMIYVVPRAFPAILINEIMYHHPSGDTYEWYEIINTGSSAYTFSGTVRLARSDVGDPYNWLGNNEIFDLGGSSIDPGERIVIGRSAVSFRDYLCNFNWVHTAPRYIKLYDGSGDLDLVYYDPAWGGDANGKTLERLSTSWNGAGYGNWRESKWDGGTPGEMNSVNPEPTTLLVLGLLGSMLGGLGITMRRKDRKTTKE